GGTSSPAEQATPAVGAAPVEAARADGHEPAVAPLDASRGRQGDRRAWRGGGDEPRDGGAGAAGLWREARPGGPRRRWVRPCWRRRTRGVAGGRGWATAPGTARRSEPTEARCAARWNAWWTRGGEGRGPPPQGRAETLCSDARRCGRADRSRASRRP